MRVLGFFIAIATIATATVLPASAQSPLAAEAPNFRDWRLAAELAIRGRLVDPASAQFTWPRGFVKGFWKPALQKRITGWVSCGEVNAKNRMGGFIGYTPFVVVMNDGVVSFLDMDSTGSRYGSASIGCQKAVAFMPPPPPGMLDDPVPSKVSGGVADELEKLASLRDRGVLTEAEFQAQKTTLLSK